MVAFFFNKKIKQLRSHVARTIVEEEYARLLGFGRLEKARILGRIDGYRNILYWLGMTSIEIERLLQQAQDEVKEHQTYKSIFK